MYIPQTQWIGDSHPMKPPKEPVIKRAYNIRRSNITKLLTERPWITAVEIAKAMGAQTDDEAQVKNAGRTMRRMYQARIVDRARSEAGQFIFGVRA